MQRINLADGIDYIVPGETPFADTSAGLLIGGTDNKSPKILIDANIERRAAGDLVDEEQPDILLVSHYHVDHSMICRPVTERTSAELWIPEVEERYFTDIDYFVQHAMGPEPFAPTFRSLLETVIGYRPLERFSTYADGTRFGSGNLTVECVRAAGHSPGHSAFYIPAHKILFVTDIGLGPFGPWYGWLDGDIAAFVDSIRRLRALDAAVIVTSHDGIIDSVINEVWDACLRKFFEHEALVRDALDAGTPRADVVESGVYFKNKHRIAEPIRSLLTIQDGIMFDHHAALLEQDSLVARFPELARLV